MAREYIFKTTLPPSDFTADDTSWVLVDTETSGLYAPIFVLEVAAQKFENLTPVGPPFQVYLNHDVPISEAATEVHGYTMEFLAAHGVNPKDAYQQFREYVGASAVCSHFLRFDWDRALSPEWLRLGEVTIGRRGFCTWAMARRALPEHPTHRLDFLRQSHCLVAGRAHSALGDVEASVDLLTRIIFPRLNDLGFNSIAEMDGFSKLNPLLLCRCLIQGLSYEDESRKFNLLRQEKAEKLADELAHILAITDEIESVCADIRNERKTAPQLIADYEIIEEDPKIDFIGREFVFTGTMKWGSRSKAGAEIEKRFGRMCKRLRRESDFLVLGEDEEAGWLTRNTGSKLTDVILMKIKNPNFPLKVIREYDFIAALEKTDANLIN